VTLRLDNPLPAILRRDEPHAQLEQHLLQHLPLFGREIAAGLQIEEGQDLDDLRRAVEIGFRLLLAREWIRDIAEMDRRVGRKADDELDEGQPRRLWLIGHRQSFYRAVRKNMSNAGAEFTRLVEIMATLRSPEGCPWDREQTLQSLSQYVLEEAYEVVDAIERGDLAALREEVGDHIFEGVFLSQVASDMRAFTVADALRAVSDKLVRRHPHVFRDDGRVHDAESKERAPSATAALSRWDTQKAQEKAASGETPATLGGLPRSLPALHRAYKIGRRAAAVGFDWTTATDVVGKIEEEIAELRETLTEEPDNSGRAEEEMGDLLFAIANLSRKLGIEPEAALRKANDKFTERFTRMEERIGSSGREITAMNLDELEAEWQANKNAATKPRRRLATNLATKTRNKS
jgi:MazG family protein